MNENKYTVDYFIRKFEAIPDDRWTTEKYIDHDDRRCAIGHCGVSEDGNFVGAETPESCALRAIFKLHLGNLCVASVNDGDCPWLFPQATPRARILAALRQAKAKEVAK